ncbi:hypothetical protein LZ30DRAFT_689752 [Colletotrichum cereale]|nr:hypothetical protein LZ30DRAFT_689752 [Colletotrichum cereale]
MHILLKLLLVFCQLNLVNCVWKPKNPFKSKGYRNQCRHTDGTSYSSGSAAFTRKTKIGIVTGRNGVHSAFYCDSDEAQAIDNSIKLMSEKAGAAYSFLSQEGAESSAAFIGWFGSMIHSRLKHRSRR